MSGADKEVVKTATNNRGTIIVDSSALIALCGDIPNQSTHSEHRQYFEVLKFLAKNGFQIVIPEISSYETAEVLAGGIDLGKVFDMNRTPEITKRAKSFLLDVSKGRFDNIEIVTDAQGTQEEDFCHKLREIVSSDETDEHKRSRIIGVQRDYPRVYALAENSVNAIAKKYSGIAGNIVVVSGIKRLRDGIEQHWGRDGRVSTLSTSEFIVSIADTKLIKHELRLPNDMAAIDVDKERIKFLESSGVYSHNPDRVGIKESDLVTFAHSRPFSYKMLAPLEEDLRDKKIAEISGALQTGKPDRGASTGQAALLS